MLFPPTPRQTYEKVPLEEVICQVRFPAILRVSATIPADFQDQMRGDFPLYEAHDPAVRPEFANVPSEVVELIASFPISGKRQPQEHRFHNEDKSRSISFSQEFLALSDKE